MKHLLSYVCSFLIHTLNSFPLLPLSKFSITGLRSLQWIITCLCGKCISSTGAHRTWEWIFSLYLSTNFPDLQGKVLALTRLPKFFFTACSKLFGFGQYWLQQSLEDLFSVKELCLPTEIMQTNWAFVTQSIKSTSVRNHCSVFLKRLLSKFSIILLLKNWYLID